MKLIYRPNFTPKIRKIIIATFIEPLDVLTTHGVQEIMKNEAREEAELRLQNASKIV